jgi:hypothetical protein
MAFKLPYSSFFKTIGLYFKIYGGSKALIRSPYLALAVVISAICHPVWSQPKFTPEWHSLPLEIIPNMLGFTLGGYAILLAFGDKEFLKLISGTREGDEKPSPFMVINGAFVHFIVLQVLSLLFALIALSRGINTGFFAAVGFTVFVYAILTAIAATFAIMNVSNSFDIFNNPPPTDENQEDN